MRRLAGVLVVVLIVTTLATVASASTANYKDQVSAPGYNGSNGSLNWALTPWYEFDDDGSPSSGRARAVTNANCPGGNYCLALFGPGLPNTVALARPANLGAFQSATLSYKVNFVVDELLSTGLLLVEGWDGVIWKALVPPYTFLNGSIQGSIDLPSSYVNAGFRVRFKVAGQLTGDVYIDDVEISGQVEGTTTTSTTTTSSTTSTTSPVTTTLPTIPTTTLPTTTTLPGLLTTSTSSTTTTTDPTTTTSADGDGTSSSTSSTSSTVSGGPATTTTTTVPGQVAASGGGDGSLPEKPVSGIRQASLGIQAGFDGGRFGEIEAVGVSVMGVDIEPNYTMAVEVIESSWVYLLGLALFIAAAIVGGLDRRRLKRAKHTSI